jgi:cysteine desulfurase
LDRIYLDYAATAPLLPAAQRSMLPWLDCGNPSSLYEEGRQAKAAIDCAREQVSAALGCLFAEVLFTSSGTEAVNTALIGLALANAKPSRTRVLLGAAEHHCVLHTAPVLQRLGFKVEFSPVDRQARIDLNIFERLLGDDVLFASVMHANNELGTLNDLVEISSIARKHGVLLHVDAIQTFGWGFQARPYADLVSISAHKIGGPKGAGALYVQAGTKLNPLLYGGGQEREMRGGTENVAAIVGFGAACRAHSASVTDLRDRLEEGLVSVGAILSVTDARRLPGHCHVRFPGIAAETMLILLDRLGISASSGAACSSGSIEPSHVLLACGYSESEAKEGLRFSLGQGTTLAEIEEALESISLALGQIKSA